MYAAKMTHHSIARMKSRCGTSKSASQKLAGAALTYGAVHTEVVGQLHRYFTKYACQDSKNIRNLRAYGDKLYVFDHDVLVTVLQLPTQFVPQVKRITQQKKRGTLQ